MSKEITGRVFAILEDLDLVYIETPDKFRYCFTETTPGVNLSSCALKQKYRCLVDNDTVVLSATLIEE